MLGYKQQGIQQLLQRWDEIQKPRGGGGGGGGVGEQRLFHGVKIANLQLAVMSIVNV